jgi:hypothetical protein
MLALALVLDAIFGEPDWLWQRVSHPAVLFGRLIERLERALNEGDNRRAKGVVAVLALVVAVCLPAWVLSWDIFLGVFEVLGAAVLIAQRSLADHVSAVADALRVSLAEGRAEVARIVGRDPETLDQAGVSRAAIESAAENFCQYGGFDDRAPERALRRVRLGGGAAGRSVELGSGAAGGAVDLCCGGWQSGDRGDAPRRATTQVAERGLARGRHRRLAGDRAGGTAGLWRGVDR